MCLVRALRLAGVLVAFCLPETCLAETQPVPLPELSASVNRLRVGHVVNPRFPRMSETQIELLLEEARKTVLEHFDVRIEFTPVEQMSIETLFALLPPSIETERRAEMFDFRQSTGDIWRLFHSVRESVRRSIEVSGSPLAEQFAYAAPYLLHRPVEVSLDGLAVALTDTLLGRIEAWRSVLAADGAPVIDESIYNEWVMWDVLGYGELPFDVVLTNQLVASVEYIGPDIHSSLRGGITAGTTSFSRTSPYHTYVWLSTFVFGNDFGPLLELRGGDVYQPREAAILAGAYLAHELGHQLLHLGHPFGARGCVMTPARLLEFRPWHHGLDAAQCPIGSHPAMEIGRPVLDYDPAWLR